MFSLAITASAHITTNKEPGLWAEAHALHLGLADIPSVHLQLLLVQGCPFAQVSCTAPAIDLAAVTPHIVLHVGRLPPLLQSQQSSQSIRLRWLPPSLPRCPCMQGPGCAWKKSHAQRLNSWSVMTLSISQHAGGCDASAWSHPHWLRRVARQQSRKGDRGWGGGCAPA